MPSSLERRRNRLKDLPPPFGVIPIDIEYPRITNVYGGEDMADDPQAKEINEAGDEGVEAVE
jgi:hypothetical protein